MNRFLYSCVQGLLMLGMIGSLAACGREKKVDVQSEFSSYVDSFKTVSAQENKPAEISDLVVKFGDTGSPNARGVCKVSDDTSPTVLVNQTTWNNITEQEREELIFHELGHCVLGRKHLSDVDTDGTPKSIMYPYSMTPSEYDSKRAKYYSELFTQN